MIGIGSLVILSTLMLSAQLALPDWVKAWGLAVVQMVFSGSASIGSLAWGAIADRLGIPWTLVLAAGGLAAASMLTVRWRLAQDTVDRTPLQHWADAVVAGDIPRDQGPVMVTVEYRVHPDRSAAFAAALERLGHVRRRDGALRAFHHTADPRRHIEAFIVENWIEHLRQHTRVTPRRPGAGAGSEGVSGGGQSPDCHAFGKAPEHLRLEVSSRNSQSTSFTGVQQLSSHKPPSIAPKCVPGNRTYDWPAGS